MPDASKVVLFGSLLFVGLVGPALLFGLYLQKKSDLADEVQKKLLPLLRKLLFNQSVRPKRRFVCDRGVADGELRAVGPSFELVIISDGEWKGLESCWAEVRVEEGSWKVYLPDGSIMRACERIKAERYFFSFLADGLIETAALNRFVRPLSILFGRPSEIAQRIIEDVKIDRSLRDSLLREVVKKEIKCFMSDGKRAWPEDCVWIEPERFPRLRESLPSLFPQLM